METITDRKIRELEKCGAEMERLVRELYQDFYKKGKVVEFIEAAYKIGYENGKKDKNSKQIPQQED